jgi:hypothetical protein
MADPITLTSLLIGAAAACGTSVVEEITKDAYAALKEKTAEIFGVRASRAIAKLENEASAEEGAKELEKYVDNDLTPEDASALEPLIAALLQAMRNDPAARDVSQNRIGLDLDVGGDALLRNLEGVEALAVKANVKGDFTLDSVKMPTGKLPGK